MSFSGRRRLYLTLLLIALGAGWGLTQPLAKIAVSEGYLHFGLVFWQVALSAVVLAVLCIAQRAPLPLHRKALAFYLLISLLGTIVPNSALYHAAIYLPSGILSVILSLVPIIAFPIALALATDHFSWRRLIGLLCGLTAVALLSLPGESLHRSGALIFLALALTAPTLYALEGNILAKWGRAGLSPIQLLLGASLVGVAISGPLAVMTGQWIDLRPPWRSPDLAILLLGSMHALVYASYIWLVGQAGVVFAAQASYLVTGFGVLWAMLILGERYSNTFWISLALMMVGLFLVRPRKATVDDGPVAG
ncbi:MAG: DMT family transporter [Pseudomonadota bacterium]